MATTYLTRTMTGSPTSNQKGTMSYWFKRSKLSVYQFLGQIGAANAGSHGADLGSTDQWTFYWEHDGSAWDMLKTNRKFRDTSAWYHIVFNWDSTLATSGDRLQLWVNGVRETDFATEVQPAQDATCLIGSAQTYNINAWSSASYFDGLMSHYHYIDGTAYAPTEFGEFDATTGEWKIKTSPSVTYGNQGYFILKDGNSVTDQSGNGNNWTVGGGTLTNTEDCPSDVFATFNPILAMNSTMSLANGNTQATTPSSYETGRSNSIFSTLGMSKGKFYTEFKAVTTPAANALIGVGFDLSSAQQGTATNQYNFSFTNLGFSYNSVGSIGNDGDGWTSTGYDTYTANDIIGVAIDCDNNKLYVSKNGTWQNSANPSSGTGGFSITADKEDFFAVADNASAEVYVYEANFGNGYFGTSAISSEGTNASGIGKFEYDVPTNYTALCTKGLNS